MKRDKFKILYFISVFVLLAIFNVRSYNINIWEPSFFIPAIVVALFVGVLGVYLFGKDMKLYKNLYFISYILTIGFAFAPFIGVHIEEGNRFYGFPAQWFEFYHIRGSVNFHLLGFLFNFFIFYFLMRLFKKMYLSLSKNKSVNDF